MSGPNPPSAAVAARIELDERIALECGVAHRDGPEVHDDDLALLLRTIRDRNGHMHGRRAAAAVALGVLARRGVAAAVAQLIGLAINPLEDDGVRLRAFGGLPPAEREQIAELLIRDPSPVVREYARRRT